MIIVGIATVVAINTFERSRTTANHNPIRQVMTDGASLAQAYYYKSEMMGGGDNSYENISFIALKLIDNEELGEFTISDVQTDSFKIIAVPASGAENIIGTVTNDGIDFDR